MSASLSASCFRNTTCKTGLGGKFNHSNKKPDDPLLSLYKFRDAQALSDSIFFPLCCEMKRKPMERSFLKSAGIPGTLCNTTQWNMELDLGFPILALTQPDTVRQPCCNSSLVFSLALLSLLSGY